MDELLLDLDVADGLPIGLVGGKAAALARLRRQGFRVPPGLVLTTEADRAVRASGGLLPDPLRSHLVDRWRATGWGAVAVRSSAVVEDRPDASMAGQLETVLGPADETTLVRAVEDVLASARSERVRSYVAHRLPDVDFEQVLCACLVQPLLEPECAGVAFGIDPVSGREDLLLVECVAGRGEALVSGAARAERHLLRRPGLGVQEQCNPSGEAGWLLDPARLRSVGEVVLAVEEVFGTPQDVEWASVGGEVVVLQARPITARRDTAPSREELLAEEVSRLRERHGHGPGLWTNLFAAELLPAPTPASLEVMLDMGRPGSGGVLAAFEADLGLGRVRHPLRADTICGRAYGEVGSLERIAADLGLPLRLVPPAGAVAWDRIDKRWVRPRWVLVPRAIAGWTVRLPRVLRRVRRLLNDGGRRFRDEDLPAIERELARQPDPLSDLADDALLAALDEARAWCSGPGRRIWERGNQAALLSMAILERRTRRWLGDDGRLATALVRRTPGNATLELNDALRDLAETARARGEDSPEVGAGFARLLDRFGHRATTELELADPRWREDPAPLRAALRHFAARRALDEAPVPAVEEVLARLGGRKRRVLGRAIERARANAFLRETPKFHYLRRYEQLRHLYLEVGRRAAARGGLGRASDVLFLLRPELPSALAGETDTAALADARQRRRAALLATGPLPQTFRWENLDAVVRAASTAAPPAAVLEGEGVSAGVARGRVRILADPSDDRPLGPDAILVAARTDPGWTLVFPAVRAVVTETGSAISHATIVAREYGLPMVVNVAGATTRLEEGSEVLVDGTRGIVSVERGAAAADGR